MAIATARLSASLARPVHCPMCGTNREPNLIALPGLRISHAERRAWIAGSEVQLTGKEFDLLAYFATRPGELVTKKQLYHDVWCFQIMPRSTRTVDSHVSRLRCKMAEIDGSSIVVDNVRGRGWRLLAGGAT